MTPTPSTPYSRDLGDELRHLRETHTTYTGTEMGFVLGWHQTKVSNVENGKVRVSEIDIVQYLTTCKRSRSFTEEFLNRYRRGFDDYFVQAPDNLRTIAFAEGSATGATAYDMSVVPGMLQTEEYARALFRLRGLISDELIDKFVRFRMQRQTILQRESRPACVFYVHESALRMQVGSSQVMEEQMRRLMFRTHVLRVVPDTAGVAGAFGASHLLWGFDKLKPVAYAETLIGQIFAQDKHAITQMRELFTHLDRIALDEAQSRGLLTHHINQLRREPYADGADVA